MSQTPQSHDNQSSALATDIPVLVYKTEPISGQTTGTSGMRKKTSVLVSNPSFLPNWVQSLFDALGGPSVLSGRTLILGGDGRFYNKTAAQTILRMAAANGFARVIVGRNALLTTPAVSALIPAREALGGIILTASHNPAGLDGDWGIKYNTGSGAPALQALTDAIYEKTQKIFEYKLADFGADIDLSSEGITSFAEGKFVVEVINPVDHYLTMLRSIFDFDALRELMARPDFSMLFDAMHASTGEYARVIFGIELGAGFRAVLNADPKEDFGGGHPDPNLTYAADLVDALDPTKNADAPQFGAASDGDGDRNMILGRGVFVSPADSVAIIADYASKAIPYFGKKGLKGVARSMPTASALDRVAEEKGVPLFYTPTGWKYFTNLMDAGKINICGEESFGTSSDHIREKDGVWAVLAWLSILAFENRDKEVGQFVTVQEILLAHWRKYGRTFNLRYDYEAVDAADAELLMLNLKGMAAGIVPYAEEIRRVLEFEYKDPVDGSVASNQGIIVQTRTGGRVVFRLSGTGSEGATLRIYFELYEAPSADMPNKDLNVVMKDLVSLALDLARVEEFIDRKAPTVIT
ncbi:putative phosphoglucomutase, cytoplasmic 2 [Gracilariopsis chorda]|uniref:phosphoglucomutase (alpha-D-glucose-1,6-bisphosphate-dependent) n=1 Tax=Gracilariopsis chorda TaxID=448386 RepID=A0A2V3IW05_9FLOR|nr:putative phosphoglucomutase, cytoplasmic 2 [Gracilariopsis chorda]|eukprot:PXF46312.1 putative phosphoglucomutase, cytoplasmic 2 [Gracilariopsis chorda]